ncbi:hypothetical protein KC19_VG121500 [Ceratodon purpureus]|uniref:Uncharacterized protein n=1 Tax=Ceratodon purpureus TaxID=3225 RepID=A0A8T0HPM6_CERPU|nr:hypothetical protein KC19_VG121500 [Ceratodon purpureus]
MLCVSRVICGIFVGFLYKAHAGVEAITIIDFVSIIRFYDILKLLFQGILRPSVICSHIRLNEYKDVVEGV